jgi:hypothetical protein
MTLGSTQSLTEISTRNRPGDKGRPARNAHNLTADCLENGSLDVSQPSGPPQPVTLPYCIHEYEWARHSGHISLVEVSGQLQVSVPFPRAQLVFWCVRDLPQQLYKSVSCLLSDLNTQPTINPTTDLGPLSEPPQLVGILLQLTYLFLVV